MCVVCVCVVRVCVCVCVYLHVCVIRKYVFQLKKVRLRTTFASADTSCGSVKLSCCEHYGNVLVEYSDNELRAVKNYKYLNNEMVIFTYYTDSRSSNSEEELPTLQSHICLQRGIIIANIYSF